MTGATGALVVTLLVELPIVSAFYPRLRTPAVALAVNVVTNTLLNRVWFSLLPAGVALVSGETLSFAIEAAVYARWLRRDVDRAITASAAANLASFLVGPLLMPLL